MREILKELDDKLTNEELDGIIDEVDADGSGTVDFDGKFEARRKQKKKDWPVNSFKPLTMRAAATQNTEPWSTTTQLQSKKSTL